MDSKKAFWIFAVLTVLMMVSDRLLFVIFPNYLLDKKFTATEIGLIFSAASFIFLISRIFIGKTSDTYGRKLIMSLGLLIQSVSVFFYPFISKIYEFSLVKGLYETSDTLTTSVKDALIADTFKKGMREKVIRKLGNAYVWGRGLAVLIGFLITTYFYSSFGFYAASLALFLSFLLFTFFIKETKIKVQRPKVKTSIRKYPFAFKMITIIGFMQTLLYAISYYPGFFILARKLNITENILFLILLTTYTLGGIIIFLTRNWIDKINKMKLSLISLLALSILVIIYPFSTSILEFFLILFGVHLFFIYFWIAFKVVLLNNAVRRFRGEQIGFQKTVEGLGNLIGPVIGGLLIDNVSLSSVFFLAGGIGLFATIFGYLLMKN
jgi:MFS family permease